MSKDELNRRIAESIEPRPALPCTQIDWSRPEYSNYGRISGSVRTWAGMGSPLRAWVSDTNGEWQPRDFHADETANAWLLEMMPNPKLVKIDHEWGVQPILQYGPAGHTWQTDRKTSICLAFAPMEGS